MPNETENTICLSIEALKQAKLLQIQNPCWQKQPLRLFIEGKGCDGFYYGVSFDARTADDLSFPQGELGEIEVVVDPETLLFVKGSKIVWVDDERGRGFLVENPYHTQFRGKFFKRKEWIKRYTQPEVV